MSVFYHGHAPGRVFRALISLCGSLALSMTILLAQESTKEAEPNAKAQIEELERVYGEGREGQWGSGEDVKGRQYWFEFQRRFPFDVIPAGAREEAIVRMNVMRDQLAATATKRGAALFSANQWSQIGPFDVGGRVRAIAVHPSIPETMYIGGASGGVWKTTDAGATWSTTFDKQGALTIGAITIDPNNPEVIYVGTGELRVASDVGYMADGVFKSTDGGQTWRNIGLNNLAAVSKILVNPKNSNIVYLTAGRLVMQGRYSGGGLGTADGFYRTTDAGASWTKTQSGRMLEMALNPDNGDELLISSSSKVWRSTDAGANFEEVIGGINNLPTTLRMSLAYDAGDPTNVFLLQAFHPSGAQVHSGNVYKSTNGGVSWSFLTAPDPNLFRNQGEYNNCIAVDPSNPDNLLIGGIDMFQSTDGGATWTNVSRTYGSTFNPEKAHPDHHIFVFDENAPGVVYVGNDGGVFASYNSGATWQRLTNSLPITQFHAVEVDQTRPFRVFGGTQDNQSQAGLGTTGHASEWTTLLGGDGFWVVVDLTNPDIIYAESQYGGMRRMNLNNIPAKANIVSGIDDAGGWSTPMVMSPVDFSLWTARTKLYRAADPRASNVSWTTLTPGFPTSADATALALHPTDAQRVIVGTGSGDVRYSTDQGETWSRSTGVPSRWLTDLAYDPQVDGRVWATFAGFKAGHVYRSDNNGATFVDVTGILPDVPANTIEIDPNNSNRLFVGTDIGVFVSLDGGASWLPFNEGMPVVPVVDMRIHRSRRMLVAATHGRSVFEVSIDNITLPATVIAPVAGAAFTTPGTMEVKWVGFEGSVNVFLAVDGTDFRLAASNVTGTSATINLPLARSSTARVRVEAVGGGRSAESGALTLTPATNVDALGKRGFAAEAVAVRNGQVWATSRGSDTIYRLRQPLLGITSSVVRSGFTGTVRDLAYNPEFDLFLALVTADDFSAPRLFKVDTTGAAVGEIPLPPSVTSAVGVAVGPEGVVIAPAGEGGYLTVIDYMTGAEIRRIPVQGLPGSYRRGLVWNGRTYTQGVHIPGRDFPSQIQQISVNDSARLYEVIPVVLNSGSDLKFFDLAIDKDGAGGETVYYATDTAGNVYRFRGELFATVEREDSWERRDGGATIAIVPNPLRGSGSVEISLDRRTTVTVDLLSTTGARAARIYDGQLEIGRQSLPIDTRLVAGGLYYVVVSDEAGNRVVAPVVVLK